MRQNQLQRETCAKPENNPTRRQGIKEKPEVEEEKKKRREFCVYEKGHSRSREKDTGGKFLTKKIRSDQNEISEMLRI